jgi:hypothetical protein
MSTKYLGAYPNRKSTVLVLLICPVSCTPCEEAICRVVAVVMDLSLADVIVVADAVVVPRTEHESRHGRLGVLESFR